MSRSCNKMFYDKRSAFLNKASWIYKELYKSNKSKSLKKIKKIQLSKEHNLSSLQSSLKAASSHENDDLKINLYQSWHKYSTSRNEISREKSKKKVTFLSTSYYKIWSTKCSGNEKKLWKLCAFDGNLEMVGYKNWASPYYFLLC